MNAMHNRRNFIKRAGLGALAGLPFPGGVPQSLSDPIIKGAAGEDSWLVRDNTAITIRISAKDGQVPVSLCTETIPPGGGIPMHKHLHHDETFHFFQGDGGIFLLDGKEFPVPANSSAFIPRDTWHGLKNTGNTLLTFMFAFTPAGFEDFFRQIGTATGRAFQPKSPEEVKLICEKFGMVFK